MRHPGRPHPRWARREIDRLDPVGDAARITHLALEVRFGEPWVASAWHTLAFCRQMAVPAIAEIIHRGGRGPAVRSTGARNDDSLALFGRLMSAGPSSADGRAAVDRLARIHSRWPISADQALYSLATLALEADRTPAHLGVTVLGPKERVAVFSFWRQVGLGLGLAYVPPTIAALERWTAGYEVAHHGFTPAGREVVDAMVADFASRYAPRRPRVAAAALLAAMDDRLLGTHRLPRPGPATRRAVAAGLAAYVAGRRLRPDPPERSWADHFHGDTTTEPGPMWSGLPAD